MRIAYNARFLSASNVTGVERVAYDLLLHLVKQDSKNEYIVFTAKKEYLGSIAISPNVTCVECSLLRGNRFLKHVWEQFVLPLYVLIYKCDVLFNPTNTAPIINFSKTILFLCDVSFMVNPKWFSKSFSICYRFIIPIISRRANAIITISQSSKNDIVKYCKVSEDKVKVVYPSLSGIFDANNDGQNDSVLANLHIRKPFVLFTGSINPRKNLKNLITAFKKYKSKFNDMEHSLIVVGAMNTNFAPEALTNDKNNNIVYVGYVDDNQLKSLYQESELFIYPSLYEGFGLPPLEAMCCGTPVIVSNTSSLPEVCGDAAIYVDPENTEQISDAINNILCNADMRKKMIMKGKERVLHFNWDDAAKNVIHITEEVSL
ncbi:MAG: glycosyltransferase family 4 protein [Endomicrobiales bacterium]|nr:glycosyltransferase family 4 protein [Endomicrobiales bacterium]